MVVFAFQDANLPEHPTDVSLRFTPAVDFIVISATDDGMEILQEMEGFR
jgi:hypothetical protein